MSRRRRLKKAVATTAQASETVYDRVSRDIPDGAVAVEVEVVDPYGDKVRVARNLRDDPLAGMLARDQIDVAQFEAGRRWQRYHERATIGSVGAIDPTKEAVDGGCIPEPITDGQIEAQTHLNAAREALGSYDTVLVYMVLGERKSLTEVADHWRMSSDLERKYLGRRFRDSLETLASLWGFAMGRRRVAC